MRELDQLFTALGKSNFRKKFALGPKDRAYLRERGMAVVLKQGETIIRERLAPAEPSNDGKQTPWRGHPVFVAQHGTGTCCRGCLAKWHGIENGKELRDEEVAYVMRVIERWLSGQGVEEERGLFG
ncbi:MAG TPA: DUF4186 domain-containing protein [Tepidisphaeraceae bacterium]